jgi:hypothetical protein
VTVHTKVVTGPGHGNHAIVGCHKSRITDPDLESGCTSIIAHKQIGCPQRKRVHRARSRHAEPAVSQSAQVLYRRERAGVNCLE